MNEQTTTYPKAKLVEIKQKAGRIWVESRTARTQGRQAEYRKMAHGWYIVVCYSSNGSIFSEMKRDNVGTERLARQICGKFVRYQNS